MTNSNGSGKSGLDQFFNAGRHRRMATGAPRPASKNLQEASHPLRKNAKDGYRLRLWACCSPILAEMVKIGIAPCKEFDLTALDSATQAALMDLPEPPRLFRRVSGSIIKLLFPQRSSLRRIPPLLASNDCALDELAVELGYSHTACLTRATRRWTGCTPGEVRRLSSSKK